MENEYINENFSQKFLNQVMNLSKRPEKHFIMIPPGQGAKKSVGASGDVKAAAIHYHQKSHERYCLFYSFASALHYAGRADLASIVVRKGRSLTDDPMNWKKFFLLLQSLHKQLCNKKIAPETFSFENVREEDCLVMCLRGSDGKEDYCVTIFNKLIFDANMENAMPLIKSNLDFCCCCNEIMDESMQTDTFVGVVRGCQFDNFYDVCKEL